MSRCWRRPMLPGLALFAASLIAAGSLQAACAVETLPERVAHAERLPGVDTLVVQGHLVPDGTGVDTIRESWAESIGTTDGRLSRGAEFTATMTGEVVTAVRGGRGSVPRQLAARASTGAVPVVQVCQGPRCGSLSEAILSGEEGLFVLTRKRTRLEPMRLGAGRWILAVDPCGSSVFPARTGH